MEQLPPIKPYIQKSEAAETLGPDLKKKVGKGSKKWRLVLPGQTNNPGHHLAVTRVPEITFKSFSFKALGQRMAAIMEWIVNPTATMRIPDPDHPGQSIKIYVNLNDVHQRVHMLENDFRQKVDKKMADKRDELTRNVLAHKPAEHQELQKSDRKHLEKDLARFATEAVLQVLQEGVAKRAESLIEEFISVHCESGADGLTVISTGQKLGISAEELRDDMDKLGDAWPRLEKYFIFESSSCHSLDYIGNKGPPAELYIIPSHLPERPMVVVDILQPTIHREYREVTAGFRSDMDALAAATGMPPVVSKMGGGEAVLGQPYVETAGTYVMTRTKEETRHVVSTGLVQTLELLDKLHKADTSREIRLANIDLDHVVLRPNGQWSLDWETETPIKGNNARTAGDLHALAEVWVSVIIGASGGLVPISEELEAGKTKLFDARLKTLGFTKEDRKALSGLFKDMMIEIISIEDAIRRAIEIFSKDKKK